MLKALNLKYEDVLAYMCDKPSELTRIMNMASINALEGADLSKFSFNKEDSKVILSVIDALETKIEAMKSVTMATESPNWIIEMLTEDRSGWPKEFAERINNAATVAKIMTIIDDIDDKIQEIKESLDDEVTLKSFTRKALKAGVIVASLANPVTAVAAAGAAVLNSNAIDKGKQKLRLVMNELYNIRRKAIARRDELRKQEYANDPNHDTYDKTKNEDSGYGGDVDDDADESGVVASFKMVNKLLDMQGIYGRYEEYTAGRRA